MRPSVYLAGPITGCSFGGCTDWRKAVRAKFDDLGIDAYSPMRAKEYLSELKGPISGTGHEYAHMGVLSTPRAVMTRDHNDATQRNALFVNLLEAKAVSIGTVMEIAWAYTHQIPIICAIEAEGNPHEHMMIREAIGLRVATLDEAVYVTRTVLLP